MNNRVDEKRNSKEYIDENLESLKERLILKEAMKKITFGIMFSLITINLWGLQYILPSIGAVYLYIGLRVFREENKEFNLSWKFSIVNMIIVTWNLIYITTPLSEKIKEDMVIIGILIVFRMIFLIVFRKAIKSYFNIRNVKLKKDPILRLIIWDIAMVSLTLIGFINSIFILVPMLCYYIYLLVQIYMLNEKVKKTNYKIKNTKVKISDKKIIILYIVSNLFVVMICCLIYNHTKLEYEKIFPVQMVEVRNELIEKGFTKEVIKDMEDRDIELLKDVAYVEVFTRDLDFNSSEKEDLKVTTIYGESENGEVYVVEHFNWLKERAYWRDEFEITSSAFLNFINGKLIYEKEGIEYKSSIPKISNRIEGDSFHYGNIENDIKGEINYPFNSKNHRGYILYKLDSDKDILCIGNLVKYTHYNSPFRIPYREIEKENGLAIKNTEGNSTLFNTKLSREEG